MSNLSRWTRRSRPLFTLYLPVMPSCSRAVPLYFMLVTSFKKNAELYDVNAVPFLIGRGVTFAPLRAALEGHALWSWFVNSLVVSLAATAISVVLGVLAAYPLARLKFPAETRSGGHLHQRTWCRRRSCSCPSARWWRGSASRQPVGARRDVSDVPRPFLHLAPHELFPHGAQGDRGVRHARPGCNRLQTW